MRTAGVSIRYPVRRHLDQWVLPDGPVPQSVPHDTTVETLRDVLVAWAKASERDVRVAHDLAIRWIEAHPRTGIDPDLCVFEPPPPGFDSLDSARLWHEEVTPPPLCFEVVSKNHPHKDYRALQDRYADMGTRELVIFDPLLVGPRSLGGPVLLQLWRRDRTGIFERIHFGNEPVYCEFLEAWLIPDDGLLAVADDRAGKRRWLTGEERERAEKEQALADKERERAEKERERADKERERAEKERERADKERERAAREALEQRVAELEAKMTPLG